jgi:hypothetical protein
MRCPDYDLCFKCYPRASLHGPNHAFKEVGDDEVVSEAVEIIEETEEREGSQFRRQLSPVLSDNDGQSTDSSV